MTATAAPASFPAAREQPYAAGDAAVTLSVNRALWGEASASLRAVQFCRQGRVIDLRFLFDGHVSEADRDSASCVAGEVTADFPDFDIREHVVVDGEVEASPGWRTVLLRRDQAA